MGLNDWRIYALASAVFASLTAIFGKIGVSDINSNMATFVRLIVIIIFTASILSFRKEWQPLHQISTHALVFLVLSGLATGCSWLCYYRALQLGPASKVAPIDKLSVALTVLIAIFILKETADWKTLLGGSLIIFGSLVLVL